MVMTLDDLFDFTKPKPETSRISLWDAPSKPLNFDPPKPLLDQEFWVKDAYKQGLSDGPSDPPVENLWLGKPTLRTATLSSTEREEVREAYESGQRDRGRRDSGLQPDSWLHGKYLFEKL